MHRVVAREDDCRVAFARDARPLVFLVGYVVGGDIHVLKRHRGAVLDRHLIAVTGERARQDIAVGKRLVSAQGREVDRRRPRARGETNRRRHCREYPFHIDVPFC